MTGGVEEPDRVEGAPHPRDTAVLYGQDAAEADYLGAAASGRLHHAWLIAGPRGVGKATLAWRMARHLLAGGTASTLQMEPTDPVFRQVAALSAPGLFLCRRPWNDKARRLRTAITVDEVRGLKRAFQLAAAEGGWRVAIVDAAEEMNTQAANALLKLLEEPPDRGALLLVSHQPGRLLPTIRSRCRTLACRALGAEDLDRALVAAGFSAGADSQALAALAEGSPGAAIRLINHDGPALYRDVLAIIGSVPRLDRRALLALAESCAGRDAAARYEAALELTRLALVRLARRAAGGDLAPAIDAERAAFERLAASPGQARLWAGLAGSLDDRTAHARAVNLDPAQVILDTFLQIDAAALDALGRVA
jgi:DNA polymerase III subunit delta'